MADAAQTKRNRFLKGEITLDEALDMTPTQLAALFHTGHALVEQGRLAEARLIFEGLAVLDSGNAMVHAMLGVIFHKLGRPAAAVGEYNQAQALLPGDIQSLVNRGEIFLKHGLLERAAADLRLAVSRDPDCRHPAANRARLLLGLLKEAVETAEQRGLDAVTEAKKRFDLQLGNLRG
ncbi:MAG TPA: tetratricopeptide repeat protein [Acidobacteriota bacterium]|nr:tetratricopeptide repeat protein [Acidobacteriota bacterium]